MRSIKFSVLATALLGVASAAVAQTPGIDTKGTVGYAIDQRGYVAKSGFGLCWRTGYWTPAMAIADCDPDLVKKPAPTPAPAPVAKAPAPTPVAAPKKCDFSATLASDETFPFNKSALTAAAKAKLDKDVVARLAGCAKVDSVTVTGHTDRLGSDKYNDALSAKRADAVKSYLAGKGVASIETKGAGKSEPLADVKCDDKMARAKLIKCLAPNRRVVVDVKGTAK